MVTSFYCDIAKFCSLLHLYYKIRLQYILIFVICKNLYRAQSSHHCPLFIGEVDSDRAPTSGYILWTSLSRGRVGGGGGGHDERLEELWDAGIRHHNLRRASCTVGSKRVSPLLRTCNNMDIFQFGNNTPLLWK